MVEFADRTRLFSYEDKSNPSGRKLELRAFVQNGDERPFLRWIDTDGDGKVTLYNDHYVLVRNNDWIEEDLDICPQRVDVGFFSHYRMAIDNYVSGVLYDVMRELDNYFYNLQPLAAGKASLRQSDRVEDLRCDPPNQTYSYTSEQCKPYRVTDFTITDSELPYATAREVKSVTVEVDNDGPCPAWTIDLTASDPRGCRSLDGCCSDFDPGYTFIIVGNSPDLSLIASIRKFYEDNVAKLDWRKANGEFYPAGCRLETSGF